MKKTYMIPTNKVVELDLEGSLLVDSQKDGLANFLSDEVVETTDYAKKENFNLWNQEW